MLLEGAQSTYDLNRELETRLAAERAKLWTQPAKALAEVRRLTGIRPLAGLPRPKVERLGAVKRTGYRIEKLILRPEARIVLPALGFVPEKPSGPAVLYLHPDGKAADAAEGGPIERLAADGRIVLAVDLRGLGETAGPADRGGLASYVGSDWKDLYIAYMLGTSYLAMRTEDVLAAARFLQGFEAGQGPNRVEIVAIGRCGPPAIHAAALEPELIDRLALRGCLASWADVVRQPLAKGRFANVVHGALEVYDLPDLLGTLPAEKLTVTDPVDALDQPLEK
jgi:hypothetical protein